MMSSNYHKHLSIKGEKRRARLSIGAWCIYDWANSAFSTVIITFVYSLYFARNIIGDEIEGSAIWGYAIAVSGFFIALSGPVLGAVADHYGVRKRWLAALSAICVCATALLWFGTPDQSAHNVIFVLCLVTLANVGFELSLVFANAMLPNIAPAEKLGRISGISWGLGYLGGLACLVLTLFGLVGLGDTAPWLDLPRENAEHIRAAAPLTALWFALFTIPLLLFARDVPRSALGMSASVKTGLANLIGTIREVRKHKNLARFLIASALYRDGLNTLFAVGGLYAAGTFDMGLEEILIFAIGLNVTAGIGAAVFGFVDDRIGSKPTILMALVALCLLSAGIIVIDDKTLFFVLALSLGIFIGPAQAASRTLAARLTPPDMAGQTYGLYAFTGKSIAFFGPLAFGLATDVFDSQRVGVATIILFWLAGMAVLTKVKER